MLQVHCFCHCLKHGGTPFFEITLGWSVTVPEFSGEPGNNDLVAKDNRSSVPRNKNKSH